MYSIAMCGPTIYRTALIEHVRLLRGDVRIAVQSSHTADAPSLISHFTPDSVILISAADASTAAQDLKRIRRVDLDVRVVWWALNSDLQQIRDALVVHNATVVSWEAPAEEIIGALGIPMSPLLKTQGRPRLTQQEHVILQLAAEGLSNRSIAFRLSVSESTIKNHLRHIGAKFNTSSRAQAVWQAVQWGYLTPATENSLIP